MKELKFKVWNGSEMVSLFDSWGSDVWVDEDELVTSSDSIKVLQYTGYKDINDVEVYEGDVFQDAAANLFTVEFGKYTKLVPMGKFRRMRINGYGLHLRNEEGEIEDISECRYAIKIGNKYEGYAIISDEEVEETKEVAEPETDVLTENQVSFI